MLPVEIEINMYSGVADIMDWLSERLMREQKQALDKWVDSLCLHKQGRRRKKQNDITTTKYYGPGDKLCVRMFGLRSGNSFIYFSSFSLVQTIFRRYHFMLFVRTKPVSPYEVVPPCIRLLCIAYYLVPGTSGGFSYIVSMYDTGNNDTHLPRYTPCVQMYRSGTKMYCSIH